MSRKKGRWGTRRLHIIKRMILNGKKLSEIAIACGVSKQAIHSGLKNHPDLHALWVEYKDKSKGLSLAQASRERNCYSVYRLTTKELARLSPEKAKLRRQQVTRYKRKKTFAKVKGKVFNIEFEDLNWPSHCPVLGIELSYFSSKKGYSYDTPSFDRLDNSKGYVKGNVFIISYKANWIKRDTTINELKNVLSYMNTKPKNAKFWFSLEEIRKRHLRRHLAQICYSRGKAVD